MTASTAPVTPVMTPDSAAATPEATSSLEVSATPPMRAPRPPRRTSRGLGSYLIESVRGRLLGGSSVIILLLAIAGLFGWRALSQMSDEVAKSFQAMREEMRLSAQLSADVAQEIESGGQYLDTRDPAVQERFRQLGWDAHRVQRAMNSQPNQSRDEIALVASIDEALSGMEVHFARAHRLADLGREGDARLAVARARPMVDTVLQHIGRLGQLKSQKVAAAADALARDSERQRIRLLSVLMLAGVAAVFVVLFITRPMRRLRDLVLHAQQLSAGNLGVRTRGEMLDEFQVLADALNQTGESLSRMVNVAAKTADNVASSAHDLAAVSNEISQSASHMASAMSEVSTGAESQVEQLRTVDATLQTMRARAERVLAGAGEVVQLARDIEHSAGAKRAEVERALAILLDVRTTVTRAASEVDALNTTTADINRFVGSVSRIAEQTNLLALNAAIEAARAGQAGRGFAVVADEVRKLAEQAQSAADDIVKMTGIVTSRVGSTTQAMQSGVARVGEIERVSRDIDEALTTITAAAERTRRAAHGVTAAAEENAAAAEQAASGLNSIARTAEGHAATAEEVSASTEEQSAACEEMSSASSQLLAGSQQLRELVGGLRTAG